MSNIGIYTALSGLQAQTIGLQTVAQNIANATTPGYTTEQANISTLPTIGPNGAGGGAYVTGINRMSDPMGQNSYLATQSSAQQANTTQATLASIENIFPEPSSTGIQSQLSSFWSSWDNVANNPSMTAPRIQVISNAQNLATSLNQSSAALTNLQNSLSSQVQTSVPQINGYLSQVASLNQSIVSQLTQGSTPNSLMDQRNVILDKLSQQLGTTITHSKSGAINIYVGGITLVQGNIADSLSLQGSAGSMSLASAHTSTAIPITLGSIAAMLTGINTTIPSFQSQLNQVASSLITTVNNQQAAGINASGTAGPAIFTGNNASNIEVNQSVVANPSLLDAAAPGTGPNNGANAQAMAELSNSTSANSPDKLYQSFIASLGTQAQTANNNATDQSALVSSVTASYKASTGVDSNTQMMQMVAYQRAYQSAAKLLANLSSNFQALLQAV